MDHAFCGPATFQRLSPATVSGHGIGRRGLGVRGPPNDSGASGKTGAGGGGGAEGRAGGRAWPRGPARRSLAVAPSAGMAGGWRALLRAARRYPWPTNVLLYAALFSAGDALQQRLRGGPADWQQTRRVATVAVTFHANFNYVWLRLLERALPGRAPRAVLAKVLCDQAIGGPVAVSAFYAGERPERGPGPGRDPTRGPGAKVGGLEAGARGSWGLGWSQGLWGRTRLQAKGWGVKAGFQTAERARAGAGGRGARVGKSGDRRLRGEVQRWWLEKRRTRRPGSRIGVGTLGLCIVEWLEVSGSLGSRLDLEGGRTGGPPFPLGKGPNKRRGDHSSCPWRLQPQ